MDPKVQEALSRRYSSAAIILLPLKDGSWACFNNARELCGIAPTAADALNLWRPCAPPPLQQEFKNARDFEDVLTAAGL